MLFAMRKIIAAFNMTLDGTCDHTSGTPDADLHQHYTDLMLSSDALLYGRITYGLMEYWKPSVYQPSGVQSMDDFAKGIDQVRKIVFSNTLKEVDWASADLANASLEEVVQNLKKEQGKPILICSRSLIIQLLNLGLIDELQLCIHPMVEGKGLEFFEKIQRRIYFNLLRTQVFKSGIVMLCYGMKKG